MPGESPRDFVVRPNGKDVYVSGDVALVHLNTATPVPKVLRTITGTGFVDELALVPDGRLYALSKPDGHAALVDLTHDSVLTTIDFRSDFSPVLSPAVSEDGTRMYMLVDDQRTAPKVLAYDTATNTQAADETVTGFDVERASGLTVGPDGESMCITSANDVEDPGVYLQIVNFRRPGLGSGSGRAGGAGGARVELPRRTACARGVNTKGVHPPARPWHVCQRGRCLG
ncbi:hypothetical protein ACWCPS_31485 [Streptomyces mauvecolor]